MLLGSLAALSACGPGDTRELRARAVRYTLSPDYREAIALFEELQHDPGRRRDQIMHGMEAAAVAVYAGDTYDVEHVGLDARQAIDHFEASEADFFAILSDEGLRVFRGEPHERSMLTYYLGLANYRRGNFNDARIYFAQSLLAASTRDDDMEQFREDFRLGHYWRGRALLHLDEEEDNARICFRKAGTVLPHKDQEKELAGWRKQRARQHKQELRSEAASYKLAAAGKQAVSGAVDLSRDVARAELPPTLESAAERSPVLHSAAAPEAFFDLDFQRRANLIVVVELGIGPLKHLAGRDGQWDVVKPNPYRERFADVYVDGHRAGPAWQLFDAWHEATTRGVRTRRHRQTAKWLAKEGLRWVPFASMAAGFWDIRADDRYVQLLPGEIHVFAAQVEPGVHHLALRCFDINERHLPRLDVDRHFIAVPAEGDVVVILNPKENESNAYLLAAHSPAAP